MMARRGVPFGVVVIAVLGVAAAAWIVDTRAAPPLAAYDPAPVPVPVPISNPAPLPADSGAPAAPPRGPVLAGRDSVKAARDAPRRARAAHAAAASASRPHRSDTYGGYGGYGARERRGIPNGK